ncbi:MAG: hypothetical protein AB7G36_14345 [Candidatus Nanopelagicales bacterium]
MSKESAGGGSSERLPAPQGPSSRAERRRAEEARARAARAQRSVWRAWWLYPLLLCLGAAMYLGASSAMQTPPATPVVTTEPTP